MSYSVDVALQTVSVGESVMTRETELLIWSTQVIMRWWASCLPTEQTLCSECITGTHWPHHYMKTWTVSATLQHMGTGDSFKASPCVSNFYNCRYKNVDNTWFSCQLKLHFILYNWWHLVLLLLSRNVVRRLLLQPRHRKEDILSLEEMLAEGVEEEVKTAARAPAPDSLSSVPRLCKVTMKALQQAAYYSAEHGYLDVTMELREMGTFSNSQTFLSQSADCSTCIKSEHMHSKAVFCINH